MNLLVIMIIQHFAQDVKAYMVSPSKSFFGLKKDALYSRHRRRALLQFGDLSAMIEIRKKR